MSRPFADDRCTVIRRRGSVIDAALDGEAILMNLDRDEIFGLGEVGSRIWDLLDPGMTFAQLCASLQAEFDVDPAVCRTETRAFVEELLAAAMVEIDQQSAPSGPSA